jgi:hypothetical protein
LQPHFLIKNVERESYLDQKFIWPQKKAHSQLWALLSYESPNHYPLQSESEINRHIDLYFNFSLQSDLPISFVCPWGGLYFEQFKEFPINVENKKEIVSFIPDCSKLNPQKLEFLQNLNSILKIDFYGKCFENKKIDPFSVKQKLEILKNYKFLLEIENDQYDGFFSFIFFNFNLLLFYFSYISFILFLFLFYFYFCFISNFNLFLFLF